MAANGQVQRRDRYQQIWPRERETDDAFENNNADHVAVHGNSV